MINYCLRKSTYKLEGSFQQFYRGNIERMKIPKLVKVVIRGEFRKYHGD